MIFCCTKFVIFLRFSAGVLTDLVLWDNNIGDEGAKALASALRVNGVLKTLDLRYNEIGDEGAILDAVSGREGFKLEM